MIKRTIDWLDHRVGVRKLIGATLLEGVPGGAKWRYVWGSCLAFVFSVQLITGILLMTAYSPSSSQAWNSVHFIQYQMDFGWLIRGLHHFGSQTMMVLIALHMLQVVIAGAHLPPREVNWWLGIGLLGVTFGLSLTGYLLPWDQKGYWATRVATNISSNLPVIGADIRQLAVGGPDYGNHTLTRFYGLHVAALPGLLILLLIAHIMIFRRHGVTSKANVEGLVTKPENEHGAECFWPRQAFYDMLACMAVFGVMLGLVLYGFGHEVKVPAQEDAGLYEQWAKAGQKGKGADLDAPADRETPNYPARPEWYFLFLFQLLKYFPGDQILIGTVYIPNGILVLLILLPLFGYGPLRKFGHFFGVLVMVTLLILAAMLTVKAFMDDSSKGIFWGLLKNTDEKEIEHADTFEKSVKAAEELAERACQLAMAGTPVEGGEWLLRNDPLTAGRKKFEKNCGSCHSFSARERKDDKEGDPFESWTGGKAASDLGNFGSEKWVRGLLNNPLGNKFFGLVRKEDKDDKGNVIKDDKGNISYTQLLTKMSGWHDDIDAMRKDENWDQEKIAKQEKEFDTIAKWLADQAKPPDKRDTELALAGQEAFFSKQNRCSTCHNVEKIEKGAAGKFKFVPHQTATPKAPDLTNYGSAEWIRSMIMSPGHKSRYGKKNTMPAFRNTDGPGAELALQELRATSDPRADGKEITITHLPDVDRELIIRWMLRDYHPVFGGTPLKWIK